MGEFSRANFYSALVLARPSANFASCPRAPSRSARLQMPNSGTRCGLGALLSHLLAEGCASPPPQRRMGALGRFPGGSAGTAGGERGQPAAVGLPAEFGVATGCVCVKLKRRTDGFPLPPSPFTLKESKGRNDFPGGEGDNSSGEREHPQNRRERRRNLSFAFHIPGVRNVAPSSEEPLWSGPSLPPPPPSPGLLLRCALESMGGAGVSKFQHLRRLCSLVFGGKRVASAMFCFPELTSPRSWWKG